MPSADDMIQQGYSPPPGFALMGGVAYVPPGFMDGYKEPFVYNIVFNPIAANAILTASANVQNDSYFVCVAQNFTNWDSATQNTTNTAPALTSMLCRIFDSSSGKFEMDAATPVGNVFGTGPQSFVWLYRARVYRPGGQITVELQNQMATSQTVRFSFIGFKVYDVPDSSAQM